MQDDTDGQGGRFTGGRSFGAGCPFDHGTFAIDTAVLIDCLLMALPFAVRRLNEE
jgi:hypothetical protein